MLLIFLYILSIEGNTQNTFIGGIFMATFKDLFNFIRTAPRSEFGFSNPTNDPYRKLHIYNNLHQVNITSVSDDLSICNITFDEDDETSNVYNVRNGYADYDHPAIYNFNDDLSVFPLSIYLYLESLFA